MHKYKLHKFIEWPILIHQNRPLDKRKTIVVTGFGKALRMRFFSKIKFDVLLISPAIELTCVQVLNRSRALLWSYRAMFAIAPHPQQSRNYCLKALLCMHMAFLYTMHIPEVN